MVDESSVHTVPWALITPMGTRPCATDGPMTTMLLIYRLRRFQWSELHLEWIDPGVTELQRPQSLSRTSGRTDREHSIVPHFPQQGWETGRAFSQKQQTRDLVFLMSHICGKELSIHTSETMIIRTTRGWNCIKFNWLKNSTDTGLTLAIQIKHKRWRICRWLKIYKVHDCDLRSGPVD